MRAAEPKDMLQAGRVLGTMLGPGDVVGLIGELGAGKTLLVKGVAEGAGVPASVTVTSPSFTLINEYRGGRVALYHVDLYRLEHEEELDGIGLFDLYRQDAATLVEWSDRFPVAVPRERLDIRITVGSDDSRELTFLPFGERGTALAKHMTDNPLRKTKSGS